MCVCVHICIHVFVCMWMYLYVACICIHVCVYMYSICVSVVKYRIPFMLCCTKISCVMQILWKLLHSAKIKTGIKY